MLFVLFCCCSFSLLLAAGCCRKLVETPFPFPWAQTTVFLLLAYAVTLPFLIVAYVERAWLGCLINFISGEVAAFCSPSPSPSLSAASEWCRAAAGLY